MSKAATMMRAGKGRQGEDRAAGYLEQAGYTILERNFRSREGEIDIIATGKGELVFVEVKNWDGLDAAGLEYAIHARKQRKLRQASRYFLYRHPQWQDHGARFDVILWQKGCSQLRHIENAFQGG